MTGWQSGVRRHAGSSTSCGPLRASARTSRAMSRAVPVRRLRWLGGYTRRSAWAGAPTEGVRTRRSWSGLRAEKILLDVLDAGGREPPMQFAVLVDAYEFDVALLYQLAESLLGGGAISSVGAHGVASHSP